MNEEDKDVLIRIGLAVLLAQSAEGLIRVCMTYVLQKDSPLTLEKLERQSAEERRKTLGYFLAELRKRAGLDPQFDKLLDVFLQERNILVHRLAEVPGYEFGSEKGRRALRTFVDGFVRNTMEVTKIFAGLLRIWQVEADLDIAVPDGHEFFAEIDSGYVPRVDDFFFEKDS